MRTNSGMRCRRLGVTAAVMFLAFAVPGVARAGTPSCAPGSGSQLQEHHFTQAEVGQHNVFRCADLQDDDFTGLSLVQLDLTGANLKHAKLSGAILDQATLTDADASGADFSHAGLGQATLTSANFTGANLADADLGQVDAKGATFVDADLTGASLVQAELGGARLDGAHLDQADFTQATLDGATFTGATGGVRWDLYVAVAAVALFLLLSVRMLITLGRSGTTGSVRAKAITVGLVGRLLLVLGLHVFVAGLYGIVGTAVGGPAARLCSGPQCAVGVDLGIWSPFLGTALAMAGLGIIAAGRVRRPVVPLPMTMLYPHYR